MLASLFVPPACILSGAVLSHSSRIVRDEETRRSVVCVNTIFSTHLIYKDSEVLQTTQDGGYIGVQTIDSPPISTRIWARGELATKLSWQNPSGAPDSPSAFEMGVGFPARFLLLSGRGPDRLSSPSISGLSGTRVSCLPVLYGRSYSGPSGSPLYGHECIVIGTVGLQISWLNVTINVLVCLTVGVVMAFTVLLCQHRLRRRRGQCTSCGFPASSGYAVCTECGERAPRP